MLEGFRTELRSRFKGSLFRVEDAEEISPNAKEYLYRLRSKGLVERVCWGWYRFPEEQTDPWEFLTKDKCRKVIVKQTAASIWNYDFIHRNVYHLAVEDRSYKRALEAYARKKGWLFEIELCDLDEVDFTEVDSLLVERPEACIVDCITDWSFLDAFATLYFRSDDVSLDRVKDTGRWRRISRTDTRVWNAVKYGCSLFNEKLGREVFHIRSTALGNESVKELIDEAVDKVIELA